MPWRENFTGRPLAVLALAAVAGVAVAEHTATALGITFILPLIAAPVGWMTWRTGKCPWSLLLTALVFALLHAVELQSTRFHPLRAVLQKRTTSMPVETVGRVEQPLRSDLPGTDPGEALFVATEVRCPITGEIWRGPTRLRLFPGRDVAPAPGTYRIEGRLRLPVAPDNPGQFDAREYHFRLGLVAELGAIRVTCLSADRWNFSAALANSAARCREWVTRTLSIDLDNQPDARAIILAMALGTIEPDAKDLETPFRESGTLHIFAVSGLHVAIVGVIFWALLRPFGLRRSVLVPVLVGALFSYAFITGMRPSAIRAAVMAAVLLIGMGLHRRTDLLNSLGAAALLLIAWDTQQVFAPGFQLSFLVLAAIGLLGKLFTTPLLPWIDPDPFLPKPLLTGPQKFTWTFRRWFAGLFTVSAAAAIGSLPLMYQHFHLVTPISLLANAFLVPLSFLVLGTAILTMLCGLLHLTFLQVLFSNANLAFAWSAMNVAQFFASIPGGNFHLPEARLSSRPPAEITVLRLPAGAAAQHLRVGDRNWLLDTGAELNFAFQVQPFLHYSGVDRLDGLVLSHSDYEHIGATLRTLREFGTPPLWAPAREPWHWEAGKSSFRALHAQGLSLSPLMQGDTLDLGNAKGMRVTATTLHPTQNNWPRRSDDRTLVLRIDAGAFRILWCNDAGFLVEKTILATLPPQTLRCDVLIRDQHADDYSLLPEFLDAAHPRIVISSNDTFPPEQKLPQRIRDECAKRGIQLLDQRETGAVTLGIWPDHISVGAMRSLMPMTLSTQH